MSQSPNDPYYNAPTEGAGYPLQGPAPNYPPNQAAGQPSFPPPPGPYPQQGSAPNYPPPPAYPQQGSAPTYPPQPGTYPQATPPYPPQSSWPGSYPPPPQGQEPYGGIPPYMPPPQGPKKSNTGLIAIISIIVVVVLILAGVGVAFAVRANNNTANAPTPTPAATATSGVTPTPTATLPTSTTPGTTTSGTLNQPVQAGTDWVVTVTNVTATTNSDLPPKAGNTYLEITLTLKNVSATTQLVSSLLQFSLADTNGAKYDESLTDTNITKTPDGNVAAGQTLNAQLAYEVPQSQHHFVLGFDYGLIDGSDSTVTWQLNV